MNIKDYDDLLKAMVHEKAGHNAVILKSSIEMLGRYELLVQEGTEGNFYVLDVLELEDTTKMADKAHEVALIAEDLMNALQNMDIFAAKGIGESLELEVEELLCRLRGGACT